MVTRFSYRVAKGVDVLDRQAVAASSQVDGKRLTVKKITFLRRSDCGGSIALAACAEELHSAEGATLFRIWTPPGLQVI